MKKAIFIMGPTAAGKTDLALACANTLPVEIISVDSAMVYRGMDIGTGKPSLSELASVPHHLIDIRDPSETYSAAEFVDDTLKLMGEITDRGRLPLLVGGTMLYFRALQQGLSPLPSAEPSIRSKLLEESQQLGWAALHNRLATIDPDSAKRIHINDPQRIQRALEVYEITGKTMSWFFQHPHLSPLADYQIEAFVLSPKDRQALHQRIEQRFHRMLEQGLVDEVEALFKRGDLNCNLPSMRAVGYRQIWQYLNGDHTREEMVYKAIAATRQLAKRQLTWLRSLDGVKWLQNNHLASLETVVHSVS